MGRETYTAPHGLVYDPIAESRLRRFLTADKRVRRMRRTGWPARTNPGPGEAHNVRDFSPAGVCYVVTT